MSAASPPILRLLRLTAGTRLVFQTQHRGELAVARVLARPVPLDLDEAVRRSALAGGDLPGGLDAAQADLLTGCAARAGLSIRGLPALLAAGVAPMTLPGLPRAGRGEGHVHVVTSWIEGPTLGEITPALPERVGLLADLARTLADIHAAGVAHGGIQPRTLVVANGGVWLVDLATPRRSAPGKLAGDVLAFGRLARRLLDGEQEGRAAAIITACMASDPATRPSMSEVAAELARAPGETIQVADPTAYRVAARAAPLIDAPTEWVPDPARPRTDSPWLAVFLLLLVAAGCALAALWNPTGC